ncbi:uncharacterized protein LOC134541572 [Bacillus rossius redtenbacheri]|uniref:uncharacterized protein LOC134541572 n=1 Tax=Bacillus rossius redtenbacheri TaxID=93214 RepID=UPI002FDCB612
MEPDVMRSLPEWLTENYIANLLCKEQRRHVPTKILDVSCASEPGDNYLGSVYRIKVECCSLEKDLIVKIMPNERDGCKFISSFGVFQRELDMYHKVLPKLYSVMKDKSGHIEYFSPYCYPTTRTDAIILEDLKPLGYHMADRKKQLDMDHALLVLSTLAKLHAFSYIMGPESIKHYHDVFFSKEIRHLSGGFLTSIVKSLCRTVSTWKGFEDCASNLWCFSESAIEHINDDVAPREDSFCVLNHGYCWTTNFLFRYCPDTGTLLDMKLIDFQLGRYSSPALDLIFFFHTSLRLDVWKQQDKLLKHYHDELTRWLASSGCSPNVYTYQDLQKDMTEKVSYALAISSTVLAIALAGPGEEPNLEKLLLESSESQTSEYHNAQSTHLYREIMQVFLTSFDKKGLFKLCDK